MTSSWVSIKLLEWLKELREVRTFISLWYNKWYWWTVRWRETQGEVQEGPEFRVLSNGLGCVIFLVFDSLPNYNKLSELCTSVILWRLPQVGMINYFQLLSHLWEMNDGAENFKLLIMVFLVISPHVGANPVSSIKWKMLLVLLSLRKLWTF